MGAGKDLFLKNKDLRAWWTGVLEDERWQTVLLHARSEFLDTLPTNESLTGARNYEGILSNLGDAPDPGSDLLVKANPGLEHFADTMPEKAKKKRK